LNDSFDVPSKSQLELFSRKDSFALEEAYRSRYKDIDPLWWAEFENSAKLSQQRDTERAGKQARSTAKTQKPLKAYDPKKDPNNVWEMPRDGTGEYRCVLVRGGHQEVDLETRCLKYCYWPGPWHRVLRGTWFLERGKNEWTPVKEHIAEQIEEAYRNEVWNHGHVVRDAGAMGVRVDLKTAGQAKAYALFVDENEMYLCQDIGVAKWWNSMRGIKVPGDRLRFGWPYEKIEDYSVRKDHRVSCGRAAPAPGPERQGGGDKGLRGEVT